MGMNGMAAMDELQFIALEIAAWKQSEARGWMLCGERYYSGDHDILKAKRTAIGDDGKPTEVENLPNSRVVDNQYAKVVDQKANYLLGKPLTFKAEQDAKQGAMEDAVKRVLDRRFQRTLLAVARDSLNCGIGWLHAHFDAAGAFCLKRIAPYEVLPFWADAAHSQLDMVVRVYETEVYEGSARRIAEHVEVYRKTGVSYYALEGGVLVPEADQPDSRYFTIRDKGKETGLNWERIPLIPFKYNDKEIPLIRKVRSLQDAINTMLSGYVNNMQEDARNTVMVLKNYDGTDLGEFRRNLATFGAVKVRTNASGEPGGVDTLTVQVDSDNYKVVLDLLKKALIENAMGYDAKDDKLSGNPNQMNIQSMYSDIDLDANGMETEYQASFMDLLWFLCAHLKNAGEGDFRPEHVRVVFNRDMMMNETEIIAGCRASVGLLSTESIVAQHPWTEDVKAEIERLAKEQAQQMADAYATGMPAEAGHDDGGQ